MRWTWYALAGNASCERGKKRRVLEIKARQPATATCGSASSYLVRKDPRNSLVLGPPDFAGKAYSMVGSSSRHKELVLESDAHEALTGAPLTRGDLKGTKSELMKRHGWRMFRSQSEVTSQLDW